MTATNDPNVWPRPHRKEKRGEFPEHDDRPGTSVLSGPEAARIARLRYEKWKAEHE